MRPTAIFLTVPALLLVGALFAQEEAPRTLTWRGCGISKKAFMTEAAAAYKDETGVTVTLSGGGATLGIQAAGEGGSDFGGTCRHCLVSEKEDELPLALTLVAWDALAVIAHPSNPVTGISVEQLKGILTQSIVNWEELGGPDLPIIVVARKGKSSGVGAMLREQILGDPDFEFGPRTLRLQSSGPVEELVETAAGAIAVTGISSGRKRKVKALALDGFVPDAEFIASGEYPYFRPLYLAHAPNLDGEAELFRNWILGPRGQAVVAKAGTVNLERGLILMGRFQSFGDKKQITNFPELMARWEVLEKERKKRAEAVR